ncbi:Uncharacterised protein [Klebsiella pneumoniae]|nr:Uncharacterised protein [Klebsiella pneumoniae]
MVEQNGGVAGADAARRFNKGLLLQNQRIAAHQTSKRRDREDRHGDDHVGHPAAHDGDHRDRQQDPRKGEQHVAKSHNEPVPPALIVASQQPKHRADGRANQHRQYPGGQRDLRPDQHPAENIPSQGVDSEPVHQRRSLVQTVVVEIIFRIVRRYPWGNDGYRNQQQHENTSAHRHRLATKAPPELMPGGMDLAGSDARHGVQRRLPSPVKQLHLTYT